MPQYYKNQLKRARRASGFKQAAFARAVGVTQSTISQIEAGQEEPGVYLALRICRALGLHVEDLFQLPEGERDG